MKFPQLILTALIVGSITFGSASAQAADSWVPLLVTGQHTYVAPSVTSPLRTDFTSDKFISELKAAAAKQNLDVYVIVTRSDESSQNLAGSGPILVRQVWDAWHKGSGDVASERALIVLMTGGSDGRLVSVGVRAGESLNAMGIVRSTMNDPQGPVLPVLRQYLSTAPSQVPIRIVNNISDIIAKSAPSSAAEALPASSDSSAPQASSEQSGSGGFLVLVLAGLGLAGAGIALIVHSSSRSSNSRDEESQSSTSSANSAFEDRLRRSASKSSGGSGNTGAGSSPSPLSLTKSASERKRKERGGSSSNTTDSGTYVAPVFSPDTSSSGTTTTSSCSSSPASSCGGGGTSCGGGGTSCGGGGGCGGGS